MTEQPTKTISDRLKEVKPRDLVYPGVILSFLIVVIIMFSLAVRFITNNINKAFSGDIGGDARTLNIENYDLVAKKLGLKVGDGKATTTPQENIVTNTESIQGATSTEATTTIDKSKISISILNSTTKKGVAGILATELTNVGFAKPTTANQKKLLATTTVLTKEGDTDLAAIILAEVQKTYKEAISTTSQAMDGYDAVIIIGTK